MGDITLNEIRDLMLWIIAFVTATFTIVKAVRTAIEKGFKPINDKIDKVDLNATKNFLVTQMHDIKRGVQLDDITRLRFFEEYEHYKDLRGNSYITNEVELLKKEGKL